MCVCVRPPDDNRLARLALKCSFRCAMMTYVHTQAVQFSHEPCGAKLFDPFGSLVCLVALVVVLRRQTFRVISYADRTGAHAHRPTLQTYAHAHAHALVRLHVCVSQPVR